MSTWPVSEDEIAAVEALLDEKGAPTESGGVTLSLLGRLRALCSNFVVEGNQRAGKLEALLATIAEEAEALNADLAAGLISQRTARTRIQNIHGIAVTPEIRAEAERPARAVS